MFFFNSVTRSLIRAINIIGLEIKTVPAPIRRRRYTFHVRQQPKPIPVRRQTDQEIIWCVCRQGEYGKMIACDAPGCTIEWFHLACVGIEKIPKGKWFCPTCSRA